MVGNYRLEKETSQLLTQCITSKIQFPCLLLTPPLQEKAGHRPPLQLVTAALIRCHNRKRIKIPYCHLPVFQDGKGPVCLSNAKQSCQMIPIT